jgi:hypothetical protein
MNAKQPPNSQQTLLALDFFDRAKQFRRGCETLPGLGRPPEWPRYLLFYHAVELALKAYLLQYGVSEKDLKDKFGHNLTALMDEAVKRGLTLQAGTRDMIADLGGQPPNVSLQNTPAHLKIRYPPDGPVYSLGQFEPHMVHLFDAVAKMLGVPSN